MVSACWIRFSPAVVISRVWFPSAFIHRFPLLPRGCNLTMLARPGQGIFEPVIPPEQFVTHGEAGCAEYAARGRLLGAAAQGELVVVPQGAVDQVEWQAGIGKATGDHRRFRDVAPLPELGR